MAVGSTLDGTNRAIVLVDNRGERAIVSDRHSLPVDAGVLPSVLPRDRAVVLLDSRWPAGAKVALDMARDASMVTVLDADGGSHAETTRSVAKTELVPVSRTGRRLE